MRFAFFFFGNDLTMPSQMVRSIRLFHPDAEITQITNCSTSPVHGITNIVRATFNENEPMFARSKLYASMDETGDPIFFLDTDMLLVQPLEKKRFCGTNLIHLCERYFNRNALVNPNFANLSLFEYAQKSMHEVWPYLGSFIATASMTPLLEIHSIYSNLPAKLRRWYGDQEALRIFANNNPEQINAVSEFEFGWLPSRESDRLSTLPAAVKLVHFKGSRKQYMNKFFLELMK